MSSTNVTGVAGGLAFLFGSHADDIAAVLDEGDLDDLSRERLGRSYRAMKRTAAHFQPIAEFEQKIHGGERLAQIRRASGGEA
jgi:hypothetical protein